MIAKVIQFPAPLTSLRQAEADLWLRYCEACGSTANPNDVNRRAALRAWEAVFLRLDDAPPVAPETVQ